MQATEVGQKIIDTASLFLNLHETAQNAAWDNPATAGQDQAAIDLLKLLEETGWQPGWAYCIAFCEVVWRKAMTDLQAPSGLIGQVATILTPSVMQSYNNLHTIGGLFPASLIPEPGSIFFMQLGSTAHGHAGIVIKVDGEKLATIEGNTSPLAGTPEADREGDGIFRKVRTLAFDRRETGLWLRGFWNPLRW